MADPIDYTDPCAVLEKLRPAYIALVAGEKAMTVEFQSGDGSSQMVTYHKANITALREEIGRLQIECAAVTSGKTKRHALRAGGF